MVAGALVTSSRYEENPLEQGEVRLLSFFHSGDEWTQRMKGVFQIAVIPHFSYVDDDLRAVTGKIQLGT